MSPTAYVLLYCLVIVFVSLLGGWVPIYVRLTHQRMQLANSLVAGFMLGVALLILLPHGLMAVPIETAIGWLIAGLLVMFFLERFFAYHHHDVPQGTAIEAGPQHQIHAVDLKTHEERPLAEALPAEPHAHDHHEHAGHAHTHHHHDHGHDDGHHHHHHGHSRPKLSWGGAATGLVLHSLIDGVSLAAAVFADPLIDGGSFWPGLAVFLVVALHRPLDSMTLLTLTAGTGWSNTKRHLLNVLFALAVPFGSAFFLLGLGSADTAHSAIGGCALAFAAGVFLCVSLSDLLPELQFHSHDRVKLSASLLLGLGLAVGVHRFESQTHDHGHAEDAHEAEDGHASELHDHAGHDHGAHADDHAGHAH